MTHVIEVAFKGNRREFYLWEAEQLPAKNAAIIVEADRGEDLGYVHATGEAAAFRNQGVPHSTGEAGPQRKARRLATSDDIRRHNDLRSQDEEARRKAMERVRANSLVMKVSDAEWQWDRKKLTFYFTAEKRVDFRTLVRELAASFRTRIELKQIGVRDEAKRLDGIGRCGRQYCSASWLPELRPVSLGVAKDQRLSLNPTQISGACGRLMCSLRYEHEFYVQARRRFPKEGKTVRTATGEEKVISNDIFRERVVLRNVEGEHRTIPLAQLLEESAAAGGTIIPAVSGSRGLPLETPSEPPAAIRGDSDVAVEDPEEHRGEDAGFAEAPREQRRQPPPRPRQPPRPPRSDRPLNSDRPQQPPRPSEQGAAEAPDQSDGAPDGERRPHRRRGRRGGRRNRGRREGGGGEGGGGSPPAGGEPQA
jgi:cell fate regulator YaaT (PSP1 superfamily)